MAAYLVEKKAFCPMKKTIIAEQAQFPSTSPAGVRSVRGDPLCLLEESSRAPSDVTGTGRGLTGIHFHKDMMSLRWFNSTQRFLVNIYFLFYYQGLMFDL